MLDLQVHCAQIRQWHRRRVFAMMQRKRNDAAILAYLRVAKGWHKKLPKSESERLKALARAAVDTAEKRQKMARKHAKAIAAGKPVTGGALPDHPLYREFSDMIDATLRAREPFDKLEDAAVKEMERLAEQLPVWTSWASAIHGFSARGLAVIVGEAGDLDDYDNRGELWKRLGLAVMDGRRQGDPGPRATDQDWKDHGYSKRRRATMWVIGDNLIKKRKSPYRAVYDARKAYELEQAAARGQTVEPASKRTVEQRNKYIAQIAIHRRAQRYTEKKLLRDLLREWKNASRAKGETSVDRTNAALPSDASEAALPPPRTSSLETVTV